MKKLFMINLSFLTLFANESTLSEQEMQALNELAKAQIPQVTYSPIKESTKEDSKKIETTGIAISSADDSVKVEVKVKKEIDDNGKDNETGSVSISKTFDW